MRLTNRKTYRLCCEILDTTSSEYTLCQLKHKPYLTLKVCDRQTVRLTDWQQVGRKWGISEFPLSDKNLQYHDHHQGFCTRSHVLQTVNRLDKITPRKISLYFVSREMLSLWLLTVFLHELLRKFSRPSTLSDNLTWMTDFELLIIITETDVVVRLSAVRVAHPFNLFFPLTIRLAVCDTYCNYYCVKVKTRVCVCVVVWSFCRGRQTREHLVRWARLFTSGAGSAPQPKCLFVLPGNKCVKSSSWMLWPKRRLKTVIVMKQWEY